jgi:hypothetical protein
MGGGTTLVEAKLLGRHAIGFDVSSLSAFLTSVKINPPRARRFGELSRQFFTIISKLNCHRAVPRPEDWISKGYQRNLSNRHTWPIRKLIEQLLFDIDSLQVGEYERNFLRCVILKTCQWALDSRKDIPNTSSFKKKLMENYQRMLSGARDFWKYNPTASTTIINKPAKEVHNCASLFPKLPRLVLTSPPYPGVHVMYHRWQIFGKRETPAPFWIANSMDGHGLSHYTMGDRHERMLTTYFKNIEDSFRSIGTLCEKQTVIVQVLAFSDVEWQLPKYLATMHSAGFSEIEATTEKIWRDVPNRKWYAQQKGKIPSSREVILFHKLSG